MHKGILNVDRLILLLFFTIGIFDICMYKKELMPKAFIGSVLFNILVVVVRRAIFLPLYIKPMIDDNADWLKHIRLIDIRGFQICLILTHSSNFVLNFSTLTTMLGVWYHSTNSAYRTTTTWILQKTE